MKLCIFDIIRWIFTLAVALDCLWIADTIKANKKVAVAGSSGYIGRHVVKELVRRGIPTVALVRNIPTISSKTLKYLEGATVVECNVLDSNSVHNVFQMHQPDSVICSLASRSGIKRDSWAVDYGAGRNLLIELEKLSSIYEPHKKPHFVLLSAFCCGKPLLQFQYAKLKLETELQNSNRITHSIIRPTAFFKSIDGQIESAREGLPVLYFGNGECAANPISERDLAHFLVDCTIKPDSLDMLNASRDIGGPDVPPITKKEQIELIYNTLQVPMNKRWTISIPIQIFDIFIQSFQQIEQIAKFFSLQDIQLRFEDAAEIARIVKYYATEPMVAIGEGEIQGTIQLKDHFQQIAERGGKLEEIDKMTTTTGVLDVFTKNEYVK